jgi:hypothetical protein
MAVLSSGGAGEIRESMSTQPDPRSPVMRRAEWWFIRQGLPKFIGRQRVRTHTLPRMFPFLILVAVFMAMTLVKGFVDLDSRLALAIVAVPSIVVWLVATRAGRRPPPVLSSWLAAVLIAIYLVAPVIFYVTLVQTHAAEAARPDQGVTEADIRSVPAMIVQASFTIVLLAVLFGLANLATRYGLVALTLHAARQTFVDLRNSFGLLGRALPSMLFLTMFLFFTGEMWQLTNKLHPLRLIGLLALFAAITLLAIGARLREELADLEQSMDPGDLVRACRGTPLEGVAAQFAPAARVVPLRRAEVLNILLVLAMRQIVRATVVGLALFLFFMVFGLVGVNRATAETWVLAPPVMLDWLPFVPVAMVKVAILLAGFTTMYFAVFSMTDSEYRERFFSSVLASISRGLAVRAVYLTLRQPSPAPPVQPPAQSPSGRHAATVDAS